MTENVLIIFVKNLIDGQVKARLANTLGDDAAMVIYKLLLTIAHNTIQSFEVDKIVFYSDFIEDDIWENNLFQKEIQTGNDLGERMKNAFAKVFEKGFKKAIVVGTDCPGINENILRDAFLKMNHVDIVIGPATDGGYYLLGMKKMHSFLFEKIKWSTDVVLQQTIDLCNKNQLTCFLLPELSDIDEEKDLIHLKNFGLKL